MNEKITPPFLSSMTGRFFSVGILIVFSALGAFFFLDIGKSKHSSSSQKVKIGEVVYSLEIADTEMRREKGLGGRVTLCESCGMLFVFETRGQYAFWMQDMRFPIDIIWLLENRIVFVQHDVDPEFSGILNPMVFADTVLELGAGKGQNLRVGEEMQFLYGG